MASREKPKYEFGGPLGAAAIVTGLPVLLYFFVFACNDISGCPVPFLLEPSALSWERLKSETGWPEGGVWELGSWKVTGVVLGYYLVSLVLWRALPAHETYGTKLVHHGRPLKYRSNASSATMAHLVVCALGTYVQGADFVCFTVNAKYPNNDLRELAAGGHTGNLVYDFYIGRELNSRVALPFFGEVDIKTWCEMRPGLTAWILLDMAFIAKQYRLYGYVSDRIVFTTIAQAYYVFDGQYNESGILTMIDITTGGFGYMLSFGDLVWVPFLYSTQCRYLSVYPVHLGWAGIATVSAVFALGLYIFKAANAQKNVFRTNPNDPSVASLSFIQTRRGTKLLTAGWWGVSRHINYFGDWLQASPFSLPTGIPGYTIVSAGSMAAASHASKMLDGRKVVQGQARGWGIFFTYFYVLYFAILLMHRERRDDAMCLEKYGEDWEKYNKL
ncbi:Uu.00g000730.m01.CDS01 [Anthostomella pinea]|uniref:Delta(14)-sterol reductase n=1 Tax=Anthostomella pinea TaxID=933095 RepID=A0AAI8VJB1_9PEZI|nr:Uu.00g000730.m01.CDS01 [Anthostomella pinea]